MFDVRQQPFANGHHLQLLAGRYINACFISHSLSRALVPRDLLGLFQHRQRPTGVVCLGMRNGSLEALLIPCSEGILLVATGCSWSLQALGRLSLGLVIPFSDCFVQELGEFPLLCFLQPPAQDGTKADAVLTLWVCSFIARGCGRRGTGVLLLPVSSLCGRPRSLRRSQQQCWQCEEHVGIDTRCVYVSLGMAAQHGKLTNCGDCLPGVCDDRVRGSRQQVVWHTDDRRLLRMG